MTTNDAMTLSDAMTHLHHLRALLGNDDALMARFVGIFKNQTPDQMAALRHFWENGDWENAANTAHAIKSQCRYFGLETEAALCQQIENAPADPEAAAWLTELEQRMVRALTSL
jgi:HPt (histidine-containing phosphotransfer) domain-containing protein